MRILLTGGAGYLGSVLLPKLLNRRHEVRVIDVGYFGLNHLKTMLPHVEMVREDLRRIQNDKDFLGRLLEGVDAVIHLAAMSNDPTADLDPALTKEINTATTKVLAKGCKDRRIKFLFSSSCSVYGGSAQLIDESGARAPLTAYAQSKVEAEDYLIGLKDSKWAPVILRNGTLHGFSPRMRFDLVVNIFSLFSILHNQIKVFGDGQQWRPFLHVSDCARAFLHFAEREKNEEVIYNVAQENLTVVQVADLMTKLTPKLEVVRVPTESEDKRNYRVTAERMRKAGFVPRVTVEMGIEEMQDAITNGLIADPESVLYQNVKWLKQLGLNPRRSLIWRAA